MGSCWTFAVKDGEIFQPNLQSFRLNSEGSNESNTWFKLRHAQTCGRDVYSTLIHVITIISLTWWNSLRLKWISLALIASFSRKTPTQYQHRPIRVEGKFDMKPDRRMYRKISIYFHKCFQKPTWNWMNLLDPRERTTYLPDVIHWV